MEASPELQMLRKRLRFEVIQSGQNLDRLDSRLGQGLNGVVSLVSPMTPEEAITEESVRNLCKILGICFEDVPHLPRWESESA